MGVYFEETTDKEDAEFIKNGVKIGDITKDLMWPSYDETPSEKDIVWNPSVGGKVAIDGITGELTEKGIKYIICCLMRQNRFTSTL